MKKHTKIIGLTGQTGAGKSIVSDMLTERGFRVIDCDLVARSVVDKGKLCLLDLSIEFGIEILNVDGTLNRKKMGAIVFGDREKRKQFNQIIFPYIQEEIASTVKKLRESGESAVFLDAPTLIESGTQEICDKTVSVIAPANERFLRIVSRDGLSSEEAEKRMNAQHGDEFYVSRSDFVIVNNGDLTELRVKVMEMLDVVGLSLPDQKAPRP